MKILTLMIALLVCSADLVIAQTSGNRGTTTTRRPNSSNFGWQDRQREAEEASEKYRFELSRMSEDKWKEAALAMMAFESDGRSFSFHDVTRIAGAEADRKAVSKEADGSTEDSPAWIVEFGKKKPKILTLTLTDRNRTQVKCEATELLEAGGGYLGIFHTEYELLCVARPAGSS